MLSSDRRINMHHNNKKGNLSVYQCLVTKIVYVSVTPLVQAWNQNFARGEGLKPKIKVFCFKNVSIEQTAKQTDAALVSFKRWSGKIPRIGGKLTRQRLKKNLKPKNLLINFG